jgi:hypothetical protein
LVLAEETASTTGTPDAIPLNHQSLHKLSFKPRSCYPEDMDARLRLNYLEQQNGDVQARGLWLGQAAIPIIEKLFRVTSAGLQLPRRSGVRRKSIEAQWSSPQALQYQPPGATAR